MHILVTCPPQREAALSRLFTAMKTAASSPPPAHARPLPCSGKLLLLAALTHQPLLLTALLPSTPSPLSATPQGFADALRWLESLRSREELLVLAATIDSSAARRPRNATAPLHLEEPWSPTSVEMKIARAAASELPTLVAKMLLQWSLVLFLLRVRALSKRRAVAMLCLCALALASRVAAHSSVSKLLVTLRASPNEVDASGQHLETMANLLNALFLACHCASAVFNAVLARAYQVYLCDPWPSVRAQWRRIPKYLGSKNLVISTLFCASAAVALMSISASELRALS